MKHLAKIQTEFLKEARKWEDLSLEDQKAYLKRHPKSKRKITTKNSKPDKNSDTNAKQTILQLKALIYHEPLNYTQFLQSDASYLKSKAKKLMSGKANTNDFEKELDEVASDPSYRAKMLKVFEKYKIPDLYTAEYKEQQKTNDLKIQYFKKKLIKDYPVLSKIEKQTTDGDIVFMDKIELTPSKIFLEFDDPDTSGYRNAYNRDQFKAEEIDKLKKYIKLMTK